MRLVNAKRSAIVRAVLPREPERVVPPKPEEIAMSSPQDAPLILYKVDKQGHFTEFGHATVHNHDVFFPDGVRGWSDVLDCRPEPYKGKSVEENCRYAAGVHKQFILVAG